MLTTVYEIRTLQGNHFLRVALSGSPEAQVKGGEVGQSYSLGVWDYENVPIARRRQTILEYRQVVRRLDDDSVVRRLLADANDIEAEMNRRAVEAEAKIQLRTMTAQLEIDRRKAEALESLARATNNVAVANHRHASFYHQANGLTYRS